MNNQTTMSIPVGGAKRNDMARSVIGLVLSIMAGAMLLLAFPAFGGWWLLAPFAVVPMVVAQYRFLPRNLSGLAMGVTWFVYWLGFSYLGMRQLQPLWVPVLIGFFALGVGTLLGSFDRVFNERTSFRYYLLTMPAVWVGWDFLVSQNMIGATEGQIHYLMGGAPALIQPISLLGSPALAYVMLMCGASLGLAVIRWLDARDETAGAVLIPVTAGVFRRVFAWGMGLTVLWVAVSVLLYSHTRAHFGPTARIATIQLGTGTGFNRDGYGAFLPETKAVYERLSRAAVADGAKLLVWPEVGLDFDPRVTNPDWVPGLARETGAYIQAAWDLMDPDGTQHNVVGLWAPDGKHLGIYNKVHPVLFDRERLDQEPLFQVFETPFGRIGMIICFDFSFYDISRTLTANGAQIITASVGDWIDVALSRVPSAQFRAVENGVGFVKGELLSGSALIDPSGVILAESNPRGDAGESTYLIADVPLGLSRTLYSYTGDLFGMLCVIGLLMRLFFQIRVRRAAVPAR